MLKLYVEFDANGWASTETAIVTARSPVIHGTQTAKPRIKWRSENFELFGRRSYLTNVFCRVYGNGEERIESRQRRCWATAPSILFVSKQKRSLPFRVRSHFEIKRFSPQNYRTLNFKPRKLFDLLFVRKLHIRIKTIYLSCWFCILRLWRFRR